MIQLYYFPSNASMAPHIVLHELGVPFELSLVDRNAGALRSPEFLAINPNGLLPALRDGELVLWDSLAICEYANERWLGGRGWPAELQRRALARAAAAEMHSGFAALRTQLPMNSRRRPDSYRWDAAAQRDIDRVQALWRTLRREHGAGGDFLFGGFGIVDAMFAPVAIRFDGYGVALDDTATAYLQALSALPALQQWRQAAEQESARVAATDALCRPG